eukprot:scaffold1340_cov277-Chaetoceros_neogracile.AAC.14
MISDYEKYRNHHEEHCSLISAHPSSLQKYTNDVRLNIMRILLRSWIVTSMSSQSWGGGVNIVIPVLIQWHSSNPSLT